jgi:hypothetical protein
VIVNGSVLINDGKLVPGTFPGKAIVLDAQKRRTDAASL